MPIQVSRLGLFMTLGMGIMVAIGVTCTACADSKVKQPKVPPGFRIELVHAPPLDSEGSWVSLAVDDRGRLFASDQYGAIYFIVPSQLPQYCILDPIA
ncbi:MAG TPA: hypothetical protein PKC18_06945, partial [Lacipirellulaceae bacterium]|nr:hypothetical protein [Lacipirellulaceae bacterium]